MSSGVGRKDVVRVNSVFAKGSFMGTLGISSLTGAAPVTSLSAFRDRLGASGANIDELREMLTMTGNPSVVILEWEDDPMHLFRQGLQNLADSCKDSEVDCLA